MSRTDCTLTKTRLTDGLWEGILTLSREFDAPPRLEARYNDMPLEGLEVRPGDRPGQFVLRLPMPARVMSDGAHVVLIRDCEADAVLATETILAGDTLVEDIRAEMALLRAELDMLKKAFRRHCVETT